MSKFKLKTKNAINDLNERLEKMERLAKHIGYEEERTIEDIMGLSCDTITSSLAINTRLNELYKYLKLEFVKEETKKDFIRKVK